ncbi:unnamed protein product [Meloidogyne enterolobii]|uniref:Uncharacterized protein n=1 Tax=Meloidogyne enterolobii TaxID=390850 RepID=A0ACB0ZCI2_MELEN
MPLFQYVSNVFSDHRTLSECRRDCFICVERMFNYLVENEPRYYILILPTFPRKVEELVNIRYYLEQIFNCLFEYSLFAEVVINPEMINLLFSTDGIYYFQLPRLHVQKPEIFPNSENLTLENSWNFVSNHLKIPECLTINTKNIYGGYMGRCLFNILAKEGYKLPKIFVKNLKENWLYDDIVEVCYLMRKYSFRKCVD